MTEKEREELIAWIKTNSRYSKGLLEAMSDKELQDMYEEKVLKGAVSK